jgi:hypothetical protein
MPDRSPVSAQPIGERLMRCTRCGTRIELCAFCESPACRHVICYRCLRQELGQSVVQPHAHGG